MLVTTAAQLIAGSNHISTCLQCGASPLQIIWCFAAIRNTSGCKSRRLHYAELITPPGTIRRFLTGSDYHCFGVTRDALSLTGWSSVRNHIRHLTAKQNAAWHQLFLVPPCNANRRMGEIQYDQPEEVT